MTWVRRAPYNSELELTATLASLGIAAAQLQGRYADLLQEDRSRR
jgi:hypothetical protein